MYAFSRGCRLGRKRRVHAWRAAPDDRNMARKQYPLRIDPAIWEAVQRWADDEMRSANGQVEWILRDALKRAGRLPKKEDVQRANEHARTP